MLSSTTTDYDDLNNNIGKIPWIHNWIKNWFGINNPEIEYEFEHVVEEEISACPKFIQDRLQSYRSHNWKKMNQNKKINRWRAIGNFLKKTAVM